MLVQNHYVARIVYLDRVLMISHHTHRHHFGFLGRLIHSIELTFVSTGNTGASIE